MANKLRKSEPGSLLGYVCSSYDPSGKGCADFEEDILPYETHLCPTDRGMGAVFRTGNILTTDNYDVYKHLSDYHEHPEDYAGEGHQLLLVLPSGQMYYSKFIEGTSTCVWTTDDGEEVDLSEY